MKTKKSKKTTGIYKVFAFDADFVTKHLDDCETLVAMQSNNVSRYLKKGGDIFYEENMNLARERLNNALEKIRNEFNQEKENYEREYLIMLSDFTSVY